MYKASFSTIKTSAKDSMRGHIGEVILAALVLPIAFSMIASVFNGFFSVIHWSVPNILATFTGAIATYITLRMIIKISRFRADTVFNDFLGTKKGILNSMGFALFTALFISGYMILFWDYFVFAWELYKFIPSSYLVGDSEMIETFINDYVIGYPSTFSIIAGILYTIFIMFITVRFSFATLVIADSDYSLIEALKKSWSITKGNFWRIVFFPLSFILWIFLAIITFGLALIYIVPYMTVANASLYNYLLKEHGDDFDDGIKRMVVDTITDDKALDIDKDIFDKNDPFESYYE